MLALMVLAASKCVVERTQQLTLCLRSQTPTPIVVCRPRIAAWMSLLSFSAIFGFVGDQHTWVAALAAAGAATSPAASTVPARRARKDLRTRGPLSS